MSKYIILDQETFLMFAKTVYGKVSESEAIDFFKKINPTQKHMLLQALSSLKFLIDNNPIFSSEVDYEK